MTTPQHLKCANRLEMLDIWHARGYTTAAEVGVYAGDFSCDILRRTAVSCLYLVDPWAGTGMSHPWDGDALLHDVEAKLETFGNRYRIMRTTSVEAARTFSCGSIDVVYIDALHDYEHCLEDIQAWRRIVARGGMLCGHDYSNRRGKGVKKAVLEVFSDWRVHETGERCSSWYVFCP